MAKNKKRGLKITAWIISVVLILGISGFFISQEREPTGVAVCSGGQILNIDDVSLRRSSELGGKQVIRVLFSTLPTAECLDIRLSPSQIENELKQDGVNDFDAQNSILGDIILTKKDKKYNIIKNNQNIYRKFGLINKGDHLTRFTVDCSNTPNLISRIREDNNKFDGKDTYYCITSADTGIDAEFASSTELEWETDVKLEGFQSLTLGNRELSGKIDNVAFVKWAGNLVGNVDLGTVRRDAYQPFTTNQFRVVEERTYEDLRSRYNSVRNEVLSDCFTDEECTAIVRNVRAYNAEFDTKTADMLSNWVRQESLVSDAQIISNQLIAILNTPIVYPQFTLDIVAEEVGIFITEGKPDVSCPDNFEIVSGDTRTITAEVKNIGENSGSFSYSVSCNKGSQSLSPSPPRNIGVGDTLDVDIRASLTVEEGTEKASCDFKATELNTLVSDSCSFSYDSTKQSQCLEGTQTCETGNTELWTCRADGTYDKASCEFGCESFEDSFRCRLQRNEVCDDGIDNDGDDLIDGEDPDCGTSTCKPALEVAGTVLIPNLTGECLRENFVWIVAVAGGILFGLFLYLILKKKFPEKNQQLILILISIVASILVGIIINIIWWILVVFGLGLIILKIII